MARKAENTFIGSVHKHLPVSLYRLKMHNQYNAGAADVWYSGPRGNPWIEYKYITHIPKSEQIAIAVSELQAEWLRDRHKEGRDVHVILGMKAGGILFNGLEWDRTFTQAELTPRVQSRQALADWITFTTTGRHADTEATPKRRQRHQRLI